MDILTGAGLYDYCLRNGLGRGTLKSSTIKHFNLALSLMAEDEEFLTAFIGVHNYVQGSITSGNMNYAYIVTNKRMIVAQKKLIGNHVYSVYMDSLNDVHFSKGLIYTTIVFDTVKEEFSVGVDNGSGQKITTKLQDIIANVRAKETPSVSSQPDDQFEQVKKLKELLDLNLITNDEYEIKRKRLLGL